ncbi:MAG: glycosyltransferase [Chitinophagales bacterium]
MAEAVGEKLRRKSRILVAPLDWGLGHTTRCIPVIKQFLANDCEVWLAGDGTQRALLSAEFPGLPFLSLNGYQIRYSKSSVGFVFKMISQIPRILSVISMEHRWLKKMIKIHGFDAVISDNRFGLYHSKIPCIFITHQLAIQNSLGKWSGKIIRRGNYKYINRFKECWVPDFPGEENLAGQLSHPEVKPLIPIKYIGLLSRFENKGLEEVKDHLLFILSGPEPQRTILENKIIDEISHYQGTATIVRGLPVSSSIIPSTGMIKFYNHLQTKELNEEIQKAVCIISRPGYSTVMDIVRLKKKSILIPTPGQTEQEYLAKHLLQKQIAFVVQQNMYSLNIVLEQIEKFNYRFFHSDNSNELEITIKDFLDNSPGNKKNKGSEFLQGPLS